MANQPKSYRLSSECLDLIEQMSKRLGLKATSVIETSIRKNAALDGIKVASTKKDTSK